MDRALRENWMVQNVNIRITGMDDKASGNSGEGALKRIVLLLSDTAPGPWAPMFERAWDSHFYMKKRRVTARGNTLTVNCASDELQDLINELKKVVAATNAAYNERVADDLRRQEEKQAKAAEDRQALKDLKDRLKFD